MNVALYDYGNIDMVEIDLPKEAARFALLRRLYRGLETIFNYVLQGRGTTSADDDHIEMNDVEMFPAGMSLLEEFGADIVKRAREAKEKREAEAKKAKPARAARAKPSPRTSAPPPAKKAKAGRPPGYSHSPSPIDRHLARASRATAPRRGRAPNSGQPCAPGSSRHRFGKDGACRVPGCVGKRAEKSSAAGGDADPEPAAARQVELPASKTDAVCFVPAWTGGDVSACMRMIPKSLPKMRTPNKARATCTQCREQIDKKAPQTRPPWNGGMRTSVGADLVEQARAAASTDTTPRDLTVEREPGEEG